MLLYIAENYDDFFDEIIAAIAPTIDVKTLTTSVPSVPSERPRLVNILL